MEFSTALNQIMILFIIMFFGYAARKTKLISENVQNAISSLLVNIGLPAMVLASTNFERTPQVLPNMINILLTTFFSYVLVILFSMLAAKTLKLPRQKSNVFISLIVFANVGFMGYPIAKAIFGEVGVFYAALVNLIFTSLVWTYGVLLYNSKEKLNLKHLLNIGTVSCLIAILLFLFDIRLPIALQTALDLTGKMSTPLSMIMIGALISDISIKSLFGDYLVYAVSFLRLLFIPLVTATALKVLHFNDTVIYFMTVMAAMPSAATNAIFAKEYDNEPLFSSIGVFITTLLCIITIPVTLFFLMLFIL